MSIMKKIFGFQDKTSETISFQSLSVPKLAGILKVYVMAFGIGEEIFQTTDDPEERLEIFIFHLSAVDLALFSQLGTTK